MVMESIFIRKNLQPGIIFIGEKHLNLGVCSYKDAFATENNPSESLKHFQDAWRCKDIKPGNQRKLIFRKFMHIDLPTGSI